MWADECYILVRGNTRTEKCRKLTLTIVIGEEISGVRFHLEKPLIVKPWQSKNCPLLSC